MLLISFYWCQSLCSWNIYYYSISSLFFKFRCPILTVYLLSYIHSSTWTSHLTSASIFFLIKNGVYFCWCRPLYIKYDINFSIWDVLKLFAICYTAVYCYNKSFAAKMVHISNLPQMLLIRGVSNRDTPVSSQLALSSVAVDHAGFQRWDYIASMCNNIS